MSETLLGQLVWPIVTLLLVAVFHRPLWRTLNQLPGFVGRSRYGVGEVDGDRPLSEIWCRGDLVYACELGDSVLETLKKMKKEVFTTVPLVDNNRKVIGVFSAQSIVDGMMATGNVVLGEETTFQKLKDSHCLDLDTRHLEFASKMNHVSSVRERYLAKWKDRKDFDIVFVTENGNANEPLLGIVTVWDLTRRV